ncbi:aldehyde dehydrogenase family protein [Algiphilus sp.]|uniref:aldehyde dehydrogenase family protein n=1 Tax=Algiphilus sp. TaxID=1872431 RepID=UPI003B523CFE
MNKAAQALETTPVASADHDEIRRIFAQQRDTMLAWRQSTAEERLARIQRLVDAVEAHTDEIVAAGAADFRKPAEEVHITEILPIYMEAKDAKRHLKKWMKSKSVPPTRMMLGTKAYMQYEPKGRALIISPWNYPLNLSFGPLVSALAAGCPTILKPSEMTPNMSALMAKIVRETFDPSEVALFEGEVDVSQTLLDLPFDHIFFTGSPQVGKIVMAAAAKHLTSVTLELGGKSPTIIDESADVDLAARTIMWGKYTNNGQTCIAPDHIYVHNSIREKFVHAAVETLKKYYGDSVEKHKESPFLARIVNHNHTHRISGLLDDAKTRGARVLYGDDVDHDDRYIAPTLLTDLPADAKIMEEEIFGPLLPIIGYDDIDEVIGKINDAPKPLALYIWSKKDDNIREVMQRTSSGGACINHAVVHFLHGNLPFGGVNNSGIGSGHGEFGFKAFSHERAVVRTRFMMARLFFPPYTKLSNAIIKILPRSI